MKNVNSKGNADSKTKKMAAGIKIIYDGCFACRN